MIFVDTSGWFSLSGPNDRHWRRAQDWWKQNRQLLVATDFVFDELMTLLKRRGEMRRASGLARDILEELHSCLEFVSREHVHAAWLLFRAHRARQWPFTDCTSCAVMRRLGVATAFAFDGHFREMGFNTVPEPNA